MDGGSDVKCQCGGERRIIGGREQPIGICRRYALSALRLTHVISIFSKLLYLRPHHTLLRHHLKKRLKEYCQKTEEAALNFMDLYMQR